MIIVVFYYTSFACLNVSECAWVVNYQGVSSLIYSGYSKIRNQNSNENGKGPIVGNDRVFKLLQNPELANEGPEPISIFIKPMKNFKKVNFPDEIKWKNK